MSGRTGSGKTTFVRYLLRSVPRYAVLDAKHTYRPPADLAELVPIVQEYDPELDQQVIRVKWEDEPDGAWEEAIQQIWEDGNRLIYVDEATLILGTRAARHPLGKAIRTGRERGIGVWTGTQRPKEIPSYVFTEAEHILSFRLQYKADREKVVEFSGDQMAALLATIRGHDAAYNSVTDDRAVILKPRLVSRGDQSAYSGGLAGNRASGDLSGRAGQGARVEHSREEHSRAWRIFGGGLNGRFRAGSNLARAG